jgi:hypothetical protein
MADGAGSNVVGVLLGTLHHKPLAALLYLSAKERARLTPDHCAPQRSREMPQAVECRFRVRQLDWRTGHTAKLAVVLTAGSFLLAHVMTSSWYRHHSLTAPQLNSPSPPWDVFPHGTRLGELWIPQKEKESWPLLLFRCGRVPSLGPESPLV